MYKFMKRLFDVLVSLCFLPFVVVLALCLAPIMYFTDKGPLFYCAERRGKNGKRFVMYKFRSMFVNAADVRNADGSTYNGPNDARVTRIGRFLRKTSLDELPQLINVLKGDMSLVGPRPTLATKAVPIDDMEAVRRKRYLVRPGITGYAQAYFRNSITQEEKFQCDAFYVDNMSFLLDLKIVLRTVFSVISQKAIYVAESGQGDCQQRNQSEKQKKLLIIGASILQLPAIQKAKEMGFYVAVADYDPKAVGIAYADEYFNVSTIDVQGVSEVAQRFGPDGIMTLATDMPMRSIAAATAACDLPGITMDTAIRSTDKGEMIRTFEKYGVEHPWYYILETREDLNAVINKITFPCISKPTDNSGSRGVVLVNGFDELEAAVAYSSQCGRSGGVILEEFLTGSEVSVEIIVLDGVVHVLQVTDKITTGAPHFVEMGHTQPSRLPQKEVKAIKDLASRAVLAVGIVNGPAHVEIMLTDDGPKMIELGARMGGDCITTHLVPLSTGIDMIKAVIELSCGIKPDLLPKFSKGSAIRFVNAGSGIIQQITGVDDARGVDGVQEVFLTKEAGEQLQGIKSSTDRVGFVVAQGENADEASAVCETAVDKIVVEL